MTRRNDGNGWASGRGSGRASGGGRRLVLAAALAVLAMLGAAALWRPVSPGMPADRPLASWSAPGKPERIVAFGTSLTASNGWPDALQARLSACLGHPVDVVRVARNDMDADWGLANVDRVIAARPDLVLVEFAINDADILEGLSRTASRARHGAILDALAEGLPDARVALMTMNPVHGRHRLQRPFLGRHYALYRDLAAARGLGLADLAPRWRAAIAEDPGLRPPDGLHPDDAATARVVVPVLASLIGRAAVTGPGAGAACAP